MFPCFRRERLLPETAAVMSVSIKVAVRCRPFTIDDKLGVNLTQNGEEEGEVSFLDARIFRICRRFQEIQAPKLFYNRIEHDGRNRKVIE